MEPTVFQYQSWVISLMLKFGITPSMVGAIPEMFPSCRSLIDSMVKADPKIHNMELIRQKKSAKQELPELEKKMLSYVAGMMPKGINSSEEAVAAIKGYLVHLGNGRLAPPINHHHDQICAPSENPADNPYGSPRIADLPAWYDQIVADGLFDHVGVAHQIAKEGWLATHEHIASRLKVSKATVRRYIETLIARGHMEAKRGNGKGIHAANTYSSKSGNQEWKPR